MKKKLNNQGGTLVEVLVTSAILAIAVSGILMSYLQSMELAELGRNMSRAMHAAQARMEQIRSSEYASIKSDYHNVSFAAAGLNGYGVSYVDDTQSDLLSVTVSVVWRQKNGRVHGEDQDLNGVLDEDEDLNSNGILDSPVLLVSRICER